MRWHTQATFSRDDTKHKPYRVNHLWYRPICRDLSDKETKSPYRQPYKIPRVPVREQDPQIRATNFEEVCYGYDLDEARLEASRCLHCRNPRCVAACPVSIRIPDFIGALHTGELQQAADIISGDSSLPSICGRVCPQESQCEGSCILGIKGEPVAIGKLERFIGDWKLEHGAAAAQTAPRNGYKVAVIGSGPAGLACASDLAKLGYEVKIFEALHKAGGVLVYGIPEFRLPKERIVAREIAEVEKLAWRSRPTSSSAVP